VEDYDDTKNLTLFIRFFHFFCSNKTSILQLEIRYFDSVKGISKQMQCRIWLNKKPKMTSDGFGAAVSHNFMIMVDDLWNEYTSFVCVNAQTSCVIWTLYPATNIFFKAPNWHVLRANSQGLGLLNIFLMMWAICICTTASVR